MVKLLLKYCTDKTINHANTSNHTPLYHACLNDNLKMVKLLLPHCTPTTINLAAKNTTTPLSWACYKNNLEIVQLLVENGAKIRQKDIDRTNDMKIKNHLKRVWQYNVSPEKLQFVMQAIKNNTNNINDIIKLEFCRSLRNCLNGEKYYKKTLFYKLCQLVKTNKNIKKAVCETFKIKDHELLETQNYMKLIKHITETTYVAAARIDKAKDKLRMYTCMFEDKTERVDFLADPENTEIWETKANKQKNIKFVINTGNKQIKAPRAFLYGAM